MSIGTRKKPSTFDKAKDSHTLLRLIKMPNQLSKIISTNYARLRANSTGKVWRIVHLAGLSAFGIAVGYFLTTTSHAEYLYIVAFLELVIANAYTAYSWKRTRPRREMVYSFMIFTAQILASLFILYPDMDGGSGSIDMLMAITWIPLTGLFTLANYYLLKRINK
ncbi:MAG: hypothetical protein Kapaf2KO_20870 [Candidatus Kapaibacteriales bacterium]